jgi:opacity protein-like surface antigen/outer membrane receptor protein involved in Fe transport
MISVKRFSRLSRGKTGFTSPDHAPVAQEATWKLANQGAPVSLRPRLLASTSFLISSLCVAGALAQAAPLPPPGSDAPAAVPAPAAGERPAGAAAPSTAQPGSTRLGTIEVTAPKPKPKPKPKRAKPAQQATPTAVARPASAPGAPARPSPYETGGPNVAGGTPVAPQLASQVTISGEDLNARPIAHSPEILEATPGLAVVQHSGSGKANQYYLRGYNLDHGTDLAVFWDDVPINLPTNAHGQGYADLNFLIPETISGLEVRKGPYFADIGDFANAGDLHLSLRDSVEKNLVSMTVGSFGYDRVLALGSTRLGEGTLLYAGEFNTYNGPWATAEDVRKFSGVLRYSQGTATDGFSATAMAYTNNWNSSDQVALRAITTGQIGLFGEIDPTDGGDTSRFMLSTRFAQSDDAGFWKANAYLVRETMDLFNNFTWVTTDPVNSDQFHQLDSRTYGGFGASRTLNSTLFNRPTETVFGVQSRYDDITIGLSDTAHRLFLSNVLVDHVDEGNVGIYAQNTTRWTDWFRTTVGWRGDFFWASVNSILQPANSGNPAAALGSPKFTMTFGPFYKTELFVGAGAGYHSNDARGVTAIQVPGDPATPQATTPFLVRSTGAEIGVRTKAIPNLDSSISLFYLHQDSELFFDGDTGTTVPGPPSLRTGIEITNKYRPASWISVDGDLALTRARFIGFDFAQEELFQSLAGFPQAQIGNAPGNFIPEAPWMVASAGITLGEKTGWFSSLRWRYISSRPLTEDGVFQSPPLNTINGNVGYRFGNGWRLQFDALNLLNSTSYNASYAYGALLTTDSLFAKCFPTPKIPVAVCQNGFMDYSIHPLDPLALRLTLAGPIDTWDSPAMAAELRRAVPAFALPSKDYNWTGFYIGGHGQFGRSSTDGSTVDLATPAAASAISGNLPGWRGGVQLGFDYMMPSRIVLGLAADVTSGGTRTAATTDAFGTAAIQTTVFDSETVRGRLGYAFDNVLVYATAGWAWSSNQYVRTQLTGTLNNATAGADEAVNIYLGGWTAGGGVSVAFAQDWNVFAEYRYTNFGSTTIALALSELTTTFTTKISAIEFGVNYKFNVGATSDPAFAVAGAGLPAAKVAPHYKALPAGSRYDWTGFYFGADGGYGCQGSEGTVATAAQAVSTPYDYGASGPFAGVLVGGNYQFNRLVLGIEGDWQWSNLTGNSQSLAPLGATGALPAGPFTISTTTRDYGSLRGRLGVAFDRFLVFGTGGWASGNPSTAFALAGSAPLVAAGGQSSGWTAGAGVEYAITDTILGRIEYRYTSLEAPRFLSAAANSADAGTRAPIGDFRAGLAYKLR